MQNGHARAVVALAFSHDGRIIASGSVDGSVKLWDPATGTQLRALKGQDTVIALEFSPNDKLLVTGSADSNVRLWDINTGRVIRTLQGHTLYVKSVCFSPDGTMLASGSADRNVKLWDVATGRELRTLLATENPEMSMGVRVAFSPDGKTLATSGERIKLWDVKTGRELRAFKLDDVKSIADIPIAFIPNENVLATGGNSIKFWDAATGNLIRTIAGDASSLSFSSDGQIIAAGQHTSIKVWNNRTGLELKSWEGPRVGLEVVAFSPDGKVLASGNNDNTVRFWDPNSGAELRVFKGHGDSVMAVSLSADSKVLAHGLIGTIGQTDTLRIWDPTTGQLLRSLIGQRHSTYSIGLSGDGSKLVSSGGGTGSVGMWNVSVAEQLKSFQGGGSPRFTPSDVAITSDGKLVAAGGRDGNVKVWEAETGRELFTMQGHRNGVRAIAFSPRGDVLATSGQDTLIKLWSVANGQELATLRGHAGGVIALAFSPDGKWLASGSQDSTIFLWNVSRRSAENSFVGNKSFVNAVAFSNDSRLLASGSDDGSIHVWDVVSDKLLHTLNGHLDRVSSIAFSGNGRLLFSGSYDTSMKLWDVTQGKELASLFSLDQQDWLVVTPDGLFDGSPPAWNQILWRFSSNLFDVAPVELFFNEYYYPGLLADLYAGKRPVAPENLEQKDRRQPTIKLALPRGPTGAATARTVGIKVEVGPAPAGAQDVRLFRNGSLVKVWRGDVLKGQARAVLEAQIPIVAGENRLTAYGFNSDNVKSADATLMVTGDDNLRQAGTLYILAIAVNKYANAEFDLRYAVADATDFAAEFQQQEAQLKNFGRVEVLSLQDKQATKQNILRALTTLGTRVKPEDAVVVYYAGHGTAQQNQFYLIPHDLGYLGPRNGVDAAGLKSVLAHSISDRELELAFEGIDAGQFLLVIDACNSGQALEAEEKRRGPMNSKGLAQLAYEKGIYILTAAQSYQAALEPSDLKHGLLTYALVEEGLKKQAADVEPRDGRVLVREWFSYVMKRVPQMQEQRMREANQGGRQLVYVEGDEKNAVEKRNVQRPRAFYRRELEDRPFIVARFAP